MNRRSFIGTLGLGLLAAPFASEAQQPARVFRLGLLGTVPLTEPGSSRIWNGFFEGLRQLGYVEGQNLVIERRFSEGRTERLPDLAADLVRLKVDVIVAAVYAADAAKGATSTIPIVMTNNSDPVGSGLVASLARPGGNVTGLSGQSPDLVGKQLQLLKEAVLKLSRVAVLSNPTHPGHPRSLREAEVAARSLKVRLQILEARAPTEFAGAFSAATKESAGALFVLGDPMFFGERTRIVELATKSHLPLMGIQKEYPEAGGLLAYGIDHRDSFRRAATYVDKILKGAKPADLPVEQPTKFELVINMKTAKALGLTIP
ncbi:MAG: transporter substrate-binding protein, partial [Anaerolineales bacterium]|nr:transporter substrate-binding protein [Anaerolineales bacterium]